ASSGQPAPSSARITVRQLIRLTRLTPEQALVVGADLVCGLRDRHASRRALGGFGAEHVTVGADGSVCLRDEVPAEWTTDQPARHADLVSARALLVELAAIAGQQPPRNGVATSAGRRAEHELAAHELAAAAGRPVEDLLTAATGLGSMADLVGAAARAELADLAAAAGSPLAAAGPAPRVIGTESSPGSRSGTGGAPGGPSDRPAGSPGQPTVPRWAALVRYGRWALVLAALAAVLVLEMVLLGNRVSADLDALSAAGRQSGAGPSATALSPLPVEPRAAGPIAGVDLRPLALCAPGAICEVRVLVRLVPERGTQRVQWTYLLTDRCTGLEHNAAGGSVTVTPGGRELVAVGQLRLPPASALSITAVTGVPARAASPPLTVPAHASC
ncbi:MAG: hypothetical protein QOG76_4237, partial [Pseudonocardiales bacterium]|nr:hypothetical protein [Pseudonocardiales bacterium]